MTWYERGGDWLSRVGTIFGAFLAAITVARLLRTFYFATFGRRRDRYKRIRRLGTNAQLPFFTSVLGEPPAMERKLIIGVTRYDEQAQPSTMPVEFKESVWIDRDFYVHALSDADQTVHAYSVTTRSTRFRPTVRPPGGTALPPNWLWRLFRKEYRFKPNPPVTLGKTRFSDLGRPQQASGWLGMHNWHYFEPYYFGNPGIYQNFVYSINDAGAWHAPFPSGWIGGFSWGFEEEPVDPKLAVTKALKEAEIREAAGDAPEPEPDLSIDDLDFEVEDAKEPPLPTELEAFRRSARVNTFTVIGPEFALDDYPLPEDRPDLASASFGVTSFRVRTLG